MPGWAYLLLSERGEVYLGATRSLRRRFRSHNSPRNDGWTKGRRWHLLAARRFATFDEAYEFEKWLKRRPDLKIIWKLRNLPRARKIVARRSYPFSPDDWLKVHRPSYVRAALKPEPSSSIPSSVFRGPEGPAA